jgi:hypothetical protein
MSGPGCSRAPDGWPVDAGECLSQVHHLLCGPALDASLGLLRVEGDSIDDGAVEAPGAEHALVAKMAEAFDSSVLRARTPLGILQELAGWIIHLLLGHARLRALWCSTIYLQ